VKAILLPTAVVLLLSACGAPRETAPEAPAATDWWIAYNVQMDDAGDRFDVYIMDGDGGNPRPVLESPGVDWVYAAHGEWLYVASDRDTSHRTLFLYRMKADGSAMERVYERPIQDAWPAINADGTEVVLTSLLDDGTPALLRVAIGGAVLDTLLTTRDFEFGSAAWGPKDSLLVFRSTESGLDELWLMPRDGSWRQRITNYPGSASMDDSVYHTGAPRWSFAHGWISALRHQDGEYDVHLFLPDGQWVRAITPKGSDEGWHDWSPDGNWLAYDATPKASDSTVVNYDIYLADVRIAEGVNLRNRRIPARLTTDPRPEFAPVFVKPMLP
jgi:TolB protein